jgi:hypothetical protein
MEEFLANEALVYRCVGAHRTVYPKPINLSAGEVVSLGERAPEENWKEWIWAERADGVGGWVPVQLIEMISAEDGVKMGMAKEAYSAMELNVDEGEAVLKIKSINGWSWVRSLDTGDEGWIPDEIMGIGYGK